MLSPPPNINTPNMSSIEQIMSMVSALSFEDKLRLNVEIAKSLANVPEKSSRKGKPAAAGTLAWIAFLAHVQKTMPERFAPPAAPKDRMQIAKAIKDEDLPAYELFVKEWIEQNPAPEAAAPDASAAAPATAAAAAPAEKPKRVISEEQKAKMKAGREKKAAEKKAAQEAVQQAENAARAWAGLPAAKPAKKAAKTPAKKAAPAPTPSLLVGGGGSVAAAEDGEMQKVDVDGDSFMLDPATNNLFGIESDGTLGAFIGRYQPGHADGNIDFDAEEA